MKSVSLVFVASVAAALAGCSASTTQWNKAGATVEDLRLDQDQCANRGSSYDFVFEDRDSGRPGILENAPDERQRRAGTATGDVYRACMESRGWRRDRNPQNPPK